MGEGAGGPRSGRGRGGGRGEVRRPEGRRGAGGGEGGKDGGGRREGAGGERSSRVTSPTRRRGRRRCRRHFNSALGLRSALSARAKEPRRGASRSHSSASLPLLSSRPPTFPPHTRRTLHTPPWPARRPPFPLPSGFPALGPPPPRARPPRPARISVSGRKGNAKPARPRGESGGTSVVAWQFKLLHFQSSSQLMAWEKQ